MHICMGKLKNSLGRGIAPLQSPPHCGGDTPSPDSTPFGATNRMQLKAHLVSSHSPDVTACAAIRQASYLYVSHSMFRRP